ncbi:hypothetical protein [Xenorhabdus sp. TH1]|uniref:hypothetical protein n=1 Tax=Xenorhabdus sp. TH1 TaxID=3130166 RepID=UPI0030CAFB4C
MKRMMLLNCLLVVAVTGCSSDKPLLGCGDYARTSTISIESNEPYFDNPPKDKISRNIAIKPVKVNYPTDYTYRENWNNVSRGGAALRKQGYRHVIASPYEIYEQGKKHVVTDRSFHTDLLLSSVERTGKNFKGNGLMKTQAPSFCGENKRSFFLKETPENKKNRDEYIRVKDKYCSDPNPPLTEEELRILTRGEPDSLRDYRLKMYIDNQREPVSHSTHSYQKGIF